MAGSGCHSGCFTYHYALVSRIASSFKDKSSFNKASGSSEIDIDKARREHEELVELLRRIGLDVIELPCDEQHPDGLFINDIAVVINNTALICHPPDIDGKASRQGEKAVVRQVLRKELGLKTVEVGSDDSLVEGGDVLWTGREIIVGLSERTNLAGAQSVAKAFPEYPTTVVKVYPPAVHLKDVITMAGAEIMTVGKSEGAQKTFKEIQRSGAPGYKYITVDEDDGANVLYCNEKLIHLAREQIPKGFAIYENKIIDPRITINMEEPLKRGGRLGSCVLFVTKVRHPKRIPTTQQ